MRLARFPSPKILLHPSFKYIEIMTEWNDQIVFFFSGKAIFKTISGQGQQHVKPYQVREKICKTILGQRKIYTFFT